MGKKGKKRPDAVPEGEPAAPPPDEGAPGAQPAAAAAQPADTAPEVPPPSRAPLPLDVFSAADLGAFFELTFPDKRLVALCHEIGLHTPGYRLETLPPDQIARVLADEYVEAKDVRPHHDAEYYIVGSSAPPDIGVQIWSQNMIPGMVARIVTGQPAKQVIDWAKGELEGIRR